MKNDIRKVCNRGVEQEGRQGLDWGIEMYIEIYGGELINLDYAKCIKIWPDEKRNKVLIIKDDDRGYLLSECDSTEQAKALMKDIAKAMEDGQKVWRLVEK